jgi:THO complex subunit 2
MLDQVQAYENLIGPVVDCYRCCTSLGFDVLVYLLVEALANPSKQRLKPDGTNIALWLNCMLFTQHVLIPLIIVKHTALALFAGTLFKHHPEVDLTGLLFYIWHQGKAGNNFDLVVLKELVTQMTGIEQLTEGISDQQLEALCGGEILRSNILVPGGVKTVKKSSAGLVKALLDTRLAIPVAILLGKQVHLL